jgi:hypothetical protein
VVELLDFRLEQNNNTMLFAYILSFAKIAEPSDQISERIDRFLVQHLTINYYQLLRQFYSPLITDTISLLDDESFPNIASSNSRRLFPATLICDYPEDLLVTSLSKIRAAIDWTIDFEDFLENSGFYLQVRSLTFPSDFRFYVEMEAIELPELRILEVDHSTPLITLRLECLRTSNLKAHLSTLQNAAQMPFLYKLVLRGPRQEDLDAIASLV